MHKEGSPTIPWNRLSAFMMAAGVAALVAAVTLFALTTTGVLGGPTYSGPGTVTGFGDLDLSSLQAAQPTPTVAPVPPSDAPLERILIPAIEVDAPISVKSLDPNGVMEAPDGPWDISWYDFTARPGFGSNAVFSGHVDYYDVGPAVLWRLRDVVQNDILEVRLTDGTVYQYQVVAMESVDAETADIAKIVGATEDEVVTLVTCSGTFDPGTGQYDQRLIVRAQRVADFPPPQT